MIHKSTLRIHKLKKITSSNKYFIEVKSINNVGSWDFDSIEITQQELKHLSKKKEDDIIKFVLEKLNILKGFY